jgi:hypothetical protein
MLVEHCGKEKVKVDECTMIVGDHQASWVGLSALGGMHHKSSV